MNPPRKTSSSRSSQERDAAPLSIDYDHLSRLCLKHWKWLVGGVVAGGLIGLVVTLFQTPVYLAMSSIEVPAKDTEVAGGVGVNPTDFSGDMIKTFEARLQTKALSERVVKSEHLNENLEFLPDGVTPPVQEETAAGMLHHNVKINIRPLTRLIDIKVEHHSPQMAQKLANWLAQAAVTQEFEQHTGSSADLSETLKADLARLRQKVAESAHALQEYQAAHNMGGGEDADARLKDLTQQYNAAQAQVTLLEERYEPLHPKLIQAKAMRDELRNEVNKAETEANASIGQNTEYAMLKTDAESYRKELDSQLTKLQDLQTSVAVAIPGLQVEEEASYSVQLSPNRTKAAALGGFAGLICGLGFIMGLYFVDSSIRTVSQAESTLNLPVIAAIPILAETDGKTILPTYSDPQSFVAESFRGLRASLILHDRENPIKTVLVVSAIPGEGKSFCAANLAVAFAQAGLKTLVIDADLRLPTLHTYFNLPPDEENTGFQDVLAGRKTLASAVVPSAISTLELLLTTTPAESPAELLSGIRLPLLLDEAAQTYDRVVIDSAPLNAVSDTILILPKADAILLVVRATQTPASESKAAVQKIYSSKMKPLGIILNYLAAHTLKSYAYGYSYGQKPKEKNAK